MVAWGTAGAARPSGFLDVPPLALGHSPPRFFEEAFAGCKHRERLCSLSALLMASRALQELHFCLMNPPEADLAVLLWGAHSPSSDVPIHTGVSDPPDLALQGRPAQPCLAPGVPPTRSAAFGIQQETASCPKWFKVQCGFRAQ